MFGLLRYDNSFNLGDEIQSIAAKQFLPHVDVLIDRDSGNMNDESKGACHVIYNAWTDGHYFKCPLSPMIKPFFLSLHINETNDTETQAYKHLDKYRVPFAPLVSHANFWKNYTPIGCRDTHTFEMFQNNGIDSFFSGCLTLTLTNDMKDKRNDEILIVDVTHDQLHYIPEYIKKKAIYLTHLVKDVLPHVEKMKLAQNLLNRYKCARLVITSRLHCCLPCLAFETPVYFLHAKALTDARFLGLTQFLDLNSKNPMLIASRPNPNVTVVITKLRKLASEWVSNTIQKCQMGVSIISACMNRQEHLQQVLSSWIAIQPTEIIIVDWSSSSQPFSVQTIVEPFQKQYQIDRFEAKKNKVPEIIVVRVTNVQKWILTIAYNFGIKFTSCQKILKLDCDTILKEHFLYYHNPYNHIFFAGDWRLARNKNERHTNGILFVQRKHFFDVGGYNELITTYGYDDDDLYNRLSVDLQRLSFQLDQIAHLEHEPALRQKHQSITNTLEVEIEFNRLVSQATKWPLSMSQFVWGSQTMFSLLSSVVLHDSVRKQCMLKAICNRFQGKKIFLEPQNGIGNRLRVLASGYHIAKASNRKLIVIWLKDHHCDASINDLFDMTELPLTEIMFLDYRPILDTSMFLDYIDPFLSYSLQDNLGIEMYNYNTSKDQYIDDTVLTHLYIKSACVLKSKHTSYQKECMFLQQLKPDPKIQYEIDTFLESHENFSNVVAVHVRSGQQNTAHDDISHYSQTIKESLNKWRLVCNAQTFLQEMQKIYLSDPKTRFFVCCDTQEVQVQLINNFPKNIVFAYPIKLYDRSVRQIQLALIDALLMSKCNLLLGSMWSSYSELVRRLANKTQKVKFAGKDFV